MNALIFIGKSINRITSVIDKLCDKIRTHYLLLTNGVKYSSLRTNGVPYIMVSRGAKGMSIGKNFAMNNGIKGNPIGQYERCTFFVAPGAGIRIGNNVGLSQCALIAMADITIGDNVKIGGGTTLYSSDFHSLDADIRRTPEDTKHRKSAPITIQEDAFIGARCTILKGVTIGARSIIGAGSVVTKSIPADEIWAGNPARFIRKVQTSNGHEL